MMMINLREYVKIAISISFILIAMQPSIYAQNEQISWGRAQNQDNGWYALEEAQRIADNVLLYQHENGGWYKNIDMADELTSAEKEELRKQKFTKLGTTIDNGATHTQLRYLAKVYNATGEERYKKSFLKGLDYILEAQYANGGWPQFYPIKQGYYEHITYNDGAMIGVMDLLHNIAIAKPTYSFVDAQRQQKSKQAIDKGLEIILATQVKVNDKLTIWCAQHDKDDLSPAKARAYELPSLSGKESAGIVEYLLKLENPSGEVKQSIRSAVQWFQDHKVMGKKVVWIEDSTYTDNRDRIVVQDSDGGPLWGRFNDITTGKPIFVGRDGIIKQYLAEIEHERRVGYNYIDNYAEKLLKEDYPEWERKY
ncbi:pectate lyase [Autumnicola psychrophila]|uniref:Pectate lyase n=1 Tax=Autumnicola psychrophila TaxID=3075592 RepID=A0ABU3DTE1_9FLAO|nr:pectate lyase [Zunongwangia sp. F225]MDT0686990.1 pectate lyase [Zunongwangia sp. F225]